MKTKEIQDRLYRGYTMAIYGTRENIHEQMTNDIKELLEAINYTRCSTLLLCERNDWYNHFTVGKKYAFMGEDERTYVVIDDMKNFQVLPKYYFKELSKQ